MLNRPEPAPTFSAGTAPSAIFITAGVLQPTEMPRMAVISSTIGSGVLTSMVRNSRVPIRPTNIAKIDTVRASMRSTRRPASGELMRMQPNKARVTMPNCEVEPPGRPMMKKLRV